MRICLGSLKADWTTSSTALGFAMSRKEARQLVLHRHFTVNGQTGEHPLLPRERGRRGRRRATSGLRQDQGSASRSQQRPAPCPRGWTTDAEKLNVNVTKLPDRADIDFDVEEHLIVELYSK